MVRSGSARRKTVWVTSNSTGLTLAPATVGPPIDLLASYRVAGASTIGGTILRTHLRFEIASPTTDTSMGFYYGLVVWDKTPASIKPSPASDFDVDWMINTFTTPGTNMPGNALLSGTSVLYGEILDLKARRRLHEMNDTLFFCLFNGGNTTPSEYSLFTKTLVALP